jgi:hypothetical protein
MPRRLLNSNRAGVNNCNPEILRLFADCVYGNGTGDSHPQIVFAVRANIFAEQLLPGAKLRIEP